MEAILIQVQPLDPATNTRVTLYVGDAPGPEFYGLGGHAWEPLITERPTIKLSLFDPDLSGKTQAGTVSFSLNLGEMRQVANPQKLNWQSAPVTIYSASDLRWPDKVEFTGLISSNTPDLDRATISLQAATSTALLDRPLLTASFDGSGGLGGDVGKRGTLKPAGFGFNIGIQPVWFDETNNIGMIDGYGNTLSITRLLEGASDFGASVGNYANYAALLSAITGGSVPPGRWATCTAQGLIGLGAPPVGVIQAEATFGVNRPGSLMYNVLRFRAGIASGLFDSAAFSSLDSALPYPVHYWTADQRSCQDLIEAIARSCNATPLVTLQGLVSVTRAVISSPVLLLDRSARVEPRVLDWASVDSKPPYSVVNGRAARPASVITRDQVNFEDTIIDRGTYDPSETYRSGNLVTVASGATFLYQNATPASGHTPPAATTPPTGPASDAYWYQQTAPTPVGTSTSITYGDGTPLENLKPAAIGADKTALNTAAAFAGQAALATQSYVYFGGSYILETNGGATATLAGFKTALGTSAAISGQGTLATQNSAAWNSQVSGRPGNVAALTGAEGIDNSRLVGPNGNRIKFSRFEAGTVGWAKRYDPSSIGGTLNTGFYLGKPYLQLSGAATTSGQQLSFGTSDSYRFPVTGSERIAVQLGFQAFGPVASRQINVNFYTSSGSSVGGGTIATQTGTAGYDTKIGGFISVPPTAVMGVVECFGNSNGSGTLDLAITDMIVATATQDQTILPPFSPGPNAFDGADPTALNTAAAFYGQGTLATLNAAGYPQILVNTLRSADSDYDSSTYSLTSPGTAFATGTSCTVAIKPSGGVQVDFIAQLTLSASSGPIDYTDAGAYVRLTWPDATYVDRPVTRQPATGPQTIECHFNLDASQTGNATVTIYIVRGSPAGGPANISITNLDLKVVWRAI